MKISTKDRHHPLWACRVLTWVVLSLALTVAAPFDDVMSYAFGQRLVYWSFVNALVILVAVLVRHVVLARVRDETLVVLTGIALAQALVLGPLLWVLNLYLLGFAVGGILWLAELTLIMGLVAFCVALIRYEVMRARRLAEAQAAAPGAELPMEGPQRPGFLDRGETSLAGELRVVSADDHFLHVTTTSQSGRVRMRFRDALSELDQIPGYRIHRSHWVAKAELVAVRPDGRRHLAYLRSGGVLPVSDAYLEDLRAAGLVQDRAIGKRTGPLPRTSISAPGAIRSDSSGRSQNSPPV